MLDLLKKSLDDCPVVSMGDYQYFVHPITDGIPKLDPALLDEVAEAMIVKADLDCDVIIAPEAMGIPLATAISAKTGIPFMIVRKRKYDLPGEIGIAQYTGYSKSDMFINGIRKGDKVVIVDDVLSTGGTMRAIINALKNIIGADVKDVLVVFEKTKDKASIEKEFGVGIKTLLKVDIVDGKVIYRE